MGVMPEAPKDGSVPGSVAGEDFIHPCVFCGVPRLQCPAASRARSPGKAATLVLRRTEAGDGGTAGTTHGGGNID
jgi:hypothetical protein